MNAEVKTAIISFSGALVSGSIGWIQIQTLTETIVVAAISTIIGYYGGKLLKYIDEAIKKKLK
jgi:hypothetical protein